MAGYSKLKNDPGQRYTGRMGGLKSFDPNSAMHEIQDPLEKAQAGLRSASNTTASMTRKQLGGDTGKTAGGAITSAVTGFASGTGLAAAAGATFGVAAGEAVTAGAIAGIASNPIGWAVGGGMLLGYLLS